MNEQTAQKQLTSLTDNERQYFLFFFKQKQQINKNQISKRKLCLWCLMNTWANTKKNIKTFFINTEGVWEWYVFMAQEYMYVPCIVQHTHIEWNMTETTEIEWKRCWFGGIECFFFCLVFFVLLNSFIFCSVLLFVRPPVYEFDVHNTKSWAAYEITTVPIALHVHSRTKLKIKRASARV